MRAECIPDQSAADLIDTLWNVKAYEVGRAYAVGDRFNRYIVECKE